MLITLKFQHRLFKTAGSYPLSINSDISVSPVISVRSGEWAGNVSDGPGWGSVGPHV